RPTPTEATRHLDAREQEIGKSLDERRGLIGEILAALQRIGRRPPPVILGRPEDALESLRTAMLLGSVLPGMRQEPTALASDLTERSRERKGLSEKRDQLARA